MLSPVWEIVRGGEPKGEVPLTIFVQASAHLLQCRSLMGRMGSLAIVSPDPLTDAQLGIGSGFESIQIDASILE